MNEDDFKRILEKALDPIKKQLGDPESGLKKTNEKLDALWDQTVKLTEDTEEIKEAFKSQKKNLNQTSDNVVKVDKRLAGVEGRLGIVAPSELSIIN